MHIPGFLVVRIIRNHRRIGHCATMLTGFKYCEVFGFAYMAIKDKQFIHVFAYGLFLFLCMGCFPTSAIYAHGIS